MVPVSRAEYAHVRNSARVVEPDAKWTSYTTEDEGENVKWWILPDKDLEYKKAQINFRLNIRLKISEIDKDMMDEKVGIPAQFACLKRRYNLVSYTTGAGKIVAFTTWQMNVELNPSTNYTQLSKLRKEVHQFSPGTKFSTDFMWKLFVAGLRPRHELDEKWSFIREETRSKENSFRASELVQSSYFDEVGVDHAHSARVRDPNCFKCGSHRHISLSCPYAEIGFQAAKRARIRREGEETDEDSKVYLPPRRNKGNPRPYKTDRVKSLQHGPKSGSSSNWRGNSSHRPRGSSPFPRQEHAKFAESDSNDDSQSEIEEFGGLSWEKRSKIPPSAWAADSGCTSPMTDNKSLFSSSLKPCRRRIQVGGAYIYSDGIGTAMVKLKDGNYIFLANTLFVPDLGCNLLSVKKMVAGDSCIGEFNSNRMIFTNLQSKKSVIEAENCRGLYIISRISDAANGQTFGNAGISSEIVSEKLNTKQNSTSKSFEAIEDDLILATNQVDQVDSDISLDDYEPGQNMSDNKCTNEFGNEILKRNKNATWGCKVITHVSRSSLPGRKDKFMPSGREGIFMGYSEDTKAHYRVYAPDMHTTIISSNVIFFEDVPGRAIANFQLWIELSKDNSQKREGFYNILPVRNKRGKQSDEKGIESAIDSAVTIDAGPSENIILTIPSTPDEEPLSSPLRQSPMDGKGENVERIITKSNSNEILDNKIQREYGQRQNLNCNSRSNRQ
ncbi:hypothetical protein HI914_01183 [Erysiphe necator]|nr:hypothetical protein HI914_01183 [Erysiphe necator]